jgi:hypothetical protein
MNVPATIDSLVHYATKDLRVGILLIVLGGGLSLWLIDRLLSLGLRRVPLDERERGWLALAAPYFQIQGFAERELGGKTFFGLWRLRLLLRKDWGITDEASARARLDGLLQYGHRSDPHYRDPDQPAADLAIVDRALLAWDGMRLVFIARCCFAVGFLDVETTWRYVVAAVRLVRERYSSWEEWGRSFATGRAIWSGDASSYYTEKVEELLRQAKSPWRRIAWHEATRA